MDSHFSRETDQTLHAGKSTLTQKSSARDDMFVTTGCEDFPLWWVVPTQRLSRGTILPKIGITERYNDEPQRRATEYAAREGIFNHDEHDWSVSLLRGFILFSPRDVWEDVHAPRTHTNPPTRTIHFRSASALQIKRRAKIQPLASYSYSEVHIYLPPLHSKMPKWSLLYATATQSVKHYRVLTFQITISA